MKPGNLIFKKQTLKIPTKLRETIAWNDKIAFLKSCMQSVLLSNQLIMFFDSTICTNIVSCELSLRFSENIHKNYIVPGMQFRYDAHKIQKYQLLNTKK